MEKDTKLVSGMRVRFTDAEMYKMNPRHYPPPGTVGVVKGAFAWSVLVQWPAGSTNGNDVWLAAYASLEICAAAAPPARPWRLMAASAGLCVAAVVLLGLAYGRVVLLQLPAAVCDLIGAAACLRWGADVDRRVQAVLEERRRMGCGRY